MRTQKIFLASSSELRADRDAFEIFLNRKNKDWVKQGVFLELIVWEDFLDAVSKTRLQDEYNRAIRECDLFVMLFFTKVGKYTAEEFETAFGQFQATGKPFIFTYFKDAEISTGNANKPVGVPGEAGCLGTLLYPLSKPRRAATPFQPAAREERRSRRRALHLPQLDSPRQPQRLRRFSGGVAFGPCFIALNSERSGL
jgi:hypothetical protein